MTYARAYLVDSLNGGTYHCISRCVRRGWLCGFDNYMQRSYEHRRVWVEQRILALAQVFSVELHGYAVMSNHYHIVVRTRPEAVADWSDEDVARRWARARFAKQSVEKIEDYVNKLAQRPERIAELRLRLTSLSWFMRLINEPIARQANREDECKGRFWEGRFKSIALLDEAAILACMVYVDANPVRAGEVKVAQKARFTSIRRRVSEAKRTQEVLSDLSNFGLTLDDYLALVAWTIRMRPKRKSSVPPCQSATLSEITALGMAWPNAVVANRHKYRAYGSSSALDAYVAKLGQRHIRAQAMPAIRIYS
jgi:hypothetical protein